MRVIVAGSRHIVDYAVVESAIRSSGFYISHIICGMARGVDLLGKRYADTHGIPVMKFPADWSLGNSAGHIRNREMAENADALILIWDGNSRGSSNMRSIAESLSLPIHSVILPIDIPTRIIIFDGEAEPFI